MSVNFAKPTYEELLATVEDQKNKLEKLQEIEQQLLSFDFYLKESLDLVCIAGFDGFYKKVNPAFIKKLGYSEADLLKTSLLNFIHPEDIVKSEQKLKGLFQCDSSLNFENRLLKKNGDVVFIEWTTSVDVSNEIIYAVGRDITQKKLKEVNLLENNELLLENTQKISKIGSWEYNYKKEKMVWSNQLFSIYELKKKRNQDLYQEYLKLFSEEDVAQFLDKIQQAKIDKTGFEIEQQALIGVNSTKWVHAIIQPVLNDEGEVDGFRGTIQDITEKKKIREILKTKKQTEVAQKLLKVEEESNAKFRRYIESSPDSIVVFDEKGKYIEVNKATSDMTGYSKGELLKMSYKDLLESNDDETVEQSFKKLLNEGVIKGEFKTKIKSGEIVWRAVNAVKLTDTRYIGFVKDISDLKRANELLINIFERITDAFVALDNNFCYTYVNKKAGEIIQRDPNIIIGKCIWDEFPDEIGGELYINMLQAKETQNYCHIEYNFYTDRWLEYNIYPSTDGMSIFFKDNTEKRKIENELETSEKRFRALVENNEGIITIIDEKLNVIFRSPSSERITGYSNKEFDEISNEDYFHPDYLPVVIQTIQNAMENPGKVFPALLKVKHKKGHYIWLEGVINNRLHDESIKGIIANFRNVTDKVSSEEELQRERDVFTKIAATSPGLIYSMRQNKDSSLSFPYASDAIKDIYGFNFEDIVNDSNKIFELIHPEDVADVIEKIITTKTTFAPLKAEYRYLHPIKGLVWHDVNSLPVLEPEGTVICHGIVTDVTDRIISEQKILKTNRLFLFISQINQMIVRTTDEQTLYKEACKIAVDYGQFKMAWIGKINKKRDKITPIMMSGDDQGYLEYLKNVLGIDTLEIQGPVGAVIESGTYIVCNDIQSDAIMNPWREEALKRGYLSLISLPIKKFGKIVGIFNFYSSERSFFDSEEINLLQEATGDVSFALEILEKEKRKLKAEQEFYESEQRYHSLTEASPVGVFRTDETGYTTYVNPSWCEMSGISPHEALGNGWLKAVHEEDRIAILNGWENATLVGEKSVSEYRFVKPNGSITWVMGQAIPEKNEKKEIIGYIGTVTDITERKYGEEKLKKANDRFEMISSATNDAVFELDFITGKSWHNKTSQEYLNLKDEDFSSEKNKSLWRSKLHPEDRDRIVNSIENCYKSNAKSWSSEFRFLKADGTYGNFYERAVIIRDASGKPIQFVGSMLDITNLKEAEEGFKKVNKKLEAILEAIPDLLFEVDITGKIFNYHSRRDDLLALPPNLFLNKKFSEVLPIEVAKTCEAALNEAYENGFSIGKQYKMEINQNFHWFELSVAIMKVNENNETHFICLSRDITNAKKGDFALEKSEERYRGLLNNLDAGIIVHAPDASIIMSNSKASELLALTFDEMRLKKNEIESWNFLNIDGNLMPFSSYPINTILKTKNPIKNYILGIHSSDIDANKWLLVNGYPTLDVHNNIVEVVISFMDITERILMENEIVEGRKQAEAANNAKTDFLANMSHEIRTPLNGIIGFTDLLMKSNLEKNQSEYMKTISESATSLMHIVNDVLDFSKVESGKLELNIEEVNLYELIKQVVDLFRYQATQKFIKLTYVIDKKVPEFVLADSIRLKQVLVNLLSNALKFTNFGEISLDVTDTGLNKKKYSGIKFSVKDTGIGIKLDNNEKIFHSFVQEDNSTSRKFGGTGLGLAISNKLLALMNSKLFLHSEYGEGSDFNFEIVLKKYKPKNENKVNIKSLQEIKERIPLKALENKRVLIVEDNKINMLLAKTLIKRLMANCTIFEAKDGYEGVALYSKEKPDVVLMDIQMPNKNGYEATYEIRALELKGDYQKTPIIAVTAGILTGEKEKCFEAGMDDYLPKPIIIPDLESTLLKWLDK